MEIDPITFTNTGPVIELSYIIASYSDETKEVAIDLISSIDVFHYDEKALIFTGVILFGFLFKLLSYRPTFINTILASLLSQDFGKLLIIGKRCLVTLLWLVFTFFIIHFTTGNFKTDKTQKYPPKQIESIKDLGKSSLIPKFFPHFPIDDIFEAGILPDYNLVWSKCKPDRYKCIIAANVRNVKKERDNRYSQKTAMIIPVKFIPVLRAFYCQGNEKKSDVERRHKSQPFTKKIFSYIGNQYMKKDLANQHKQM